MTPAEFRPGTSEVEHAVDMLTGGVTADDVDNAGGLLDFAETCAQYGCSCDEPFESIEERCLGCQGAHLIDLLEAP